MSIGTVTIVAPTYKRPDKLRRAVQSISNQTYRDLKILVFDNASSDGTKEVVQELIDMDSRVSYYCHDQNIGMNGNFNFAFCQVETPYFGILTDDDYFLPSFIDDAMERFKQHPQIQLSILRAPTVDERGNVLGDQLARWPREGLYAPGESISIVAKGHHPIITACLFRRDVLKEMVFDEEAGAISDLPVLAILLAKYPFYLSKKIGAYFISHDGNAGNDSGNKIAYCLARSRYENIIRDNATINLRSKATILKILRRDNDRIYFRVLLKSLMEGDSAALQFTHGKSLERRLSAYQIAGLFVYATSHSRVISRCLGWVLNAIHKRCRAKGPLLTAIGVRTG